MHLFIQVILGSFLLAASPSVSAQKQAAVSKEDYPFQIKVTGTGKQALIFLPGFACSGDVWNETLPAFSSQYTCHVLTMAGFAGAPPQPHPQLTDWVEKVAEYIRVNGLKQPEIVGHSLGGVMALMLASKHPDLVSRIVVVDALPCLNALYNPQFSVQGDPHCEDAAARTVGMTQEQFLQSEKLFIPRMIADTAHRAEIIRWGVQSDRSTYGGIYCQFNNTDLRETIKQVRCPALILLEPAFGAMKPAVEAQYANLAGALLRYATKGLHFIMFDDRDWYLEQLHSFL